VLRVGNGISNPRGVTEAVHRFNVERKEKDKRTGRTTTISIRTFDLKDFFTNVPRLKFVAALREGLQLAKAMDPRLRFF
jgi:hypothetical protein